MKTESIEDDDFVVFLQGVVNIDAEMESEIEGENA
jgi:hypothetical protein